MTNFKMKINSTVIEVIFATIFLLGITSCVVSSDKKNVATASKDSVIPSTEQTVLREKVLTAEEQAALTPDMVIQSLKEGNNHFMNNNITSRDHSAMVRNAARAQYPKAVILSCLDSRVPVEDVFNKGIGDVFVARVAGNFVNEDILGSMEFGCKVSGAKLILVFGHESCGAIKSAIDDVKLGNITAMLAKIKPAVIISQDFVGEKTSKNAAFVDYTAKNNILNTIETIKAKSSILKEMEEKDEIKIVGAYYNINTGEVIFMQ